MELQSVKPHFPLPDISAEYRQGFNFGYIEIAGIWRQIEWEDIDPADPYELSGEDVGWGGNLSTNIRIADKTIFRGSYLIGEGVQNYMNDAPVDVGIRLNPGSTVTPIVGEALGVKGIVAFIDHNWNDKFSTSLGYSSIKIDNSDGQAPDAFKKGQYVVGNLMYYPVKNAMMGIEFQYGDRVNFSDGWNTSISKVQLSFKYNFSQDFFDKK